MGIRQASVWFCQLSLWIDDILDWFGITKGVM